MESEKVEYVRTVRVPFYGKIVRKLVVGTMFVCANKPCVFGPDRGGLFGEINPSVCRHLVFLDAGVLS